jgi:hypothetical protein
MKSVRFGGAERTVPMASFLLNLRTDDVAKPERRERIPGILLAGFLKRSGQNSD